MAQLLTVALSAATLVHDARHVHGARVGVGTALNGGSAGRTPGAPITAAAFQFPHNRYRKRAPSSVELGYSREEGGAVHDLLHPKRTPFFFDDDADADREGDFVAGGWEDFADGVEGESGIADGRANDTDERRSRRLRSLDDFNRANAHRASKNDGERRGGDSSERPSSGSDGARPPPTGSDLELPFNDPSQLQAIRSNAPAMLLPSGPGTGKSHVLSLRIAYLLQKYIMRTETGDLANESTGPESSDVCAPDSMVILSFTNRDAERLKRRALDYLFPDGDAEFVPSMSRNETSRRLWAGTMHAFSLAILHKYGPSSSRLRVLPAREMRNRVSASLRALLNARAGEEGSGGPRDGQLRSRHLQALNDVGQSRSNLQQNIVRCIDLWKEANVPLRSAGCCAYVAHPPAREGRGDLPTEEDAHHDEDQQREDRVREACIELAMRLGIPESSALLALDVYPEYQDRHAAAGTADPSDLAGTAYRLLLDRPEALHLLRSKLRHIIVDEYQDMSVSQHALLRLVVRGVTDEDERAPAGGAARERREAERRRRRRLPVLLEPGASRPRPRRRSRASAAASSSRRSYSVPSIFCAGDASQSIYGWRGGAPELTVCGFRRDYPQGVVAPLSTCYRLPSDVVDAASMLLPAGLDLREEYWDCGVAEDPASYGVSPAAAARVGSTAAGGSSDGSCPRKSFASAGKYVRLGNQLLLSKGMRKLDSTVVIRGLWDSREEAKYIASTIRRRSKERRKALMGALSNLDDDISFSPGEELLDLTDVAVMVRSSKQLHLIREALDNAGIPFVSDTNERADAGEAQNWLSRKRARPARTVPMKPATVMTMHRSKGEEFDDVYLAGWTEGDFPHPEAVSSNRVHEERRLAYVALTRARQRVAITHSIVRRVLHYGRDGRKKYVTSQAPPSRFLYELVPSKRTEDGVAGESGEVATDVPWLPSGDNEGTIWDRSAGVKDFVAGKDVPHFFQKAYQQPKGYVAKISDVRRFSDVSKKTSAKLVTGVSPPTTQPEQGTKISRKTSLEIIEDALEEIIVLRKKGASKKYVPVFKEMLASFFQLRRGNALVFASGARSEQTRNGSVRALAEAPADELVERPLGRCTATQLGHYLAYLILTPEGTSAPVAGPRPANSRNPSCREPNPPGAEESLEIIEDALRDIVVLRRKGASGYFGPVFREMLASLFNIHRGSALVLAPSATGGRITNGSVRALMEASADEVTRRPLGRCTATQLGHYLAYLILAGGEDGAKKS